MLARTALRSTRAVGAVRNGAIHTSKVRQPHNAGRDAMPKRSMKRDGGKENILTMLLTAFRFIELLRCLPLPTEHGWRNLNRRGNRIGGMVLSSLRHRITRYDAGRRRVSRDHTIIIVGMIRRGWNVDIGMDMQDKRTAAES